MRLPILAVGQPEIMDLIKDHEDVFTGIGKLKGVTVKLRVVPNAPCQVPITNKEEYLCPLKEKFDQILDSWHSLDIIEDVGDELTHWCSNVVLTPKDSGKSRHNRR